MVFKLKIYGPEKEWNKVIKKSKQLKNLYPIKPVLGEDYNKAIGSAKVALSFFSKLNRDVYTRRCFEIPAARVVQIASYSEELTYLFEENTEIVLFKNIEELCVKINKLLQNSELRNSIANEGFKRVWNSGYDVNSRTQVLIRMMKDL
jgi:spore maturation protein CgeB